MLTIGLGPAFVGGSGGGNGNQQGQTIFDLDFVEVKVSPTLKTTSITEFPLVDTSLITTMVQFFANCTKLVSIAKINTPNLVDMSYMCYNCSQLQSFPHIDTSNVTLMKQTFQYCEKLTTIPALDTSQVTEMSSMFRNSGLVTLPALNTARLSTTSSMFNTCTNLKEVLGLDMTRVTATDTMFMSCSNLETCYLKGLKNHISLGDSPKLSKESVLYLFNNAQTVSSTKTISLHADVFAKLTDAEIATATEKGFSVISK